MAEVEKMEVDDDVTHNLNIYFLTPGLSKGDGLFKIHNIDFKSITTDNLKQLIVEADCKRTGIEEKDNEIKDIDLLYNGRVLGPENTLEAQQIKPGAIIHVVKNFTKVDAEASGSSSTQPKPTPEHIREISMALRTAFLSPSFLKTIEKLKNPERLQTIFAAAPGLETDLAGIAIVQNPHLIFQLSEKETLARLAETRPWILEALHQIAAVVHAEKGSKSSRLPASVTLNQLLNSYYDGDEEYDMDEDEEGEPSRAQSQPNIFGPITREQLSQALNAVPAFGRGGTSPSAGGGAGAFMNFLNTPTTSSSRPSSAPPSNPPPNFQQLLQNALASIPQQQQPSTAGASASATTLTPGSSSQGTPALTGDMVARAMQDAFSQLPPEDRNRQYEMFRQLALQVAGGNPPTGSSPSVPAQSTSSTSSSPYEQQLRQMRELGITSDRLSLLALRVSDGDVQTAAELIFSGWDGSGADAEPDS